MCCDVLVTVEPHWFILRVACVAVWLRLVPITRSHLMMLDDIWVGVCTLSSSASYYLTLLCLRTQGLVLVTSHAGLSRGAETQLQDTGDTGSYRHTLSPRQSSEHAAEKCTCVLCSGNIAKNVLFSRKISPDISFCQQSCIALHYMSIVLLLEYNIDWFNNEQLQQKQSLLQWISMKLNKYFYGWK